MRKVGEVAPDFTLSDEQGRPVTLSSFRGQNAVVLVFYPGDGTPVCTAQLCEMRDAYSSLDAAGAVVLGLNPRGHNSHRRFTERYRFPFPLLVDTRSAVAHLYGTAFGWGVLSVTLRSVFVVGLEGRLVFAAPGRPAPQQVLQPLQAAGTSRAAESDPPV